MTAWLGPGPAAIKEVRALLPVWTATAAALLLVPAVGRTDLASLAYLLGTVLLGAQAIGGEYSHRTLGVLLTQPVARSRILLTKLGVLLAMLAITAGLWGTLPESGIVVRQHRREVVTIATLAPLYALTLAPLLTMVGRSALAGTVFTVAIPGMLLVLADFAGALIHGADAGAVVDAFSRSVFLPAILTVCAFAGWRTWRMFLRLEVIDGGREPAPARAIASAVHVAGPGALRRPLTQLLLKEMRLQQLAFAVAGLFVIAWIAIAVVQRVAPEATTIPLWPTTALYLALLCVLIGSLASAEERQLGTLDAQLLLPVPAWRQWAVKAAVANGLALLLAVGLPLLLAVALPPRTLVADAGAVRAALLPVLVITTGSLYVSTLCVGGVRAMVLSLPFLAVLTLAMNPLAALWSLVFSRVCEWCPGPPLGSMGHPFATRALMSLAGASLVIAFLFAGLANHRSAERGPGRTARQLLATAAFVIGVTVISAVALAVIAVGRA